MKTWLSLITIAALAACSPADQDEVALNTPAAEPAEAAATDESGEDVAEDETAGLPGTDIHLFALDWSGEAPVLGASLGGVTRAGYDNQPFFVDDGSLLYTAGDETGETDIWRLDLTSGETTPVTQTPGESEYSPRIAPDGRLSYIYQPPGGYAGNAYLANPDNSDRQPAEALAPVGYYGFSGDMRAVAVFHLGEPMTLQLIDRTTTPETVTHIADNPGRSFFRAGRGPALYVTLGDEDGVHTVHALNTQTGELREMFALPGTVQDFAVAIMPDDRVTFLTVHEGQLVWRAYGGWQPIGAIDWLTGVTRLALSPDLSTLAVVAEE
ncbi:TolB family protein [Maricaulis maris]|uniref:WD40 repeat protein n=1 Tax=Maricaulis maris TaxID=74318 RepID=A0A495DMM0_9PROT|nr:PD40 domain-containing protein [Maricaulis maris]RKR04168.1 WD40 repeat protein [Maricaulis maris]